MDLENPVSVEREKELKVLSTLVNPVRLKNKPIDIDSLASKQLYARIVF